MRDYIQHISEKDFEEVCKKVIATHEQDHPLRYIPADWDWQYYPDIGFSTIIDDATGISLTRGHHNYTRLPDGELLAEEVILRCSPSNGMGDPFIADSKAQLQKLINETFNL